MTDKDKAKDREQKDAADRRCPNCGKPTDPAHRPFCSRRCTDVDLNRWLSDRYIIPGR